MSHKTLVSFVLFLFCQVILLQSAIAEDIYKRGCELYKNGDYASALNYFQYELKIHPANAAAAYAAGSTAQILKKRIDAIYYYRQAYIYDSGDIAEKARKAVESLGSFVFEKRPPIQLPPRTKNKSAITDSTSGGIMNAGGTVISGYPGSSKRPYTFSCPVNSSTPANTNFIRIHTSKIDWSEIIPLLSPNQVNDIRGDDTFTITGSPVCPNLIITTKSRILTEGSNAIGALETYVSANVAARLAQIRNPRELQVQAQLRRVPALHAPAPGILRKP